MKNVILVDIDDTISHAEWRRPLLPKDVAAPEEAWEGYYLAMDRDLPSIHMRNLLIAVHASGHFRIIYFTARPVKWHNATRRWLVKHSFPDAEILMRPEGNHEASPVCKITMIKKRFPDWKSRVALLIEDRADIIAAFKAEGVSCLQSHLEQAA